MNAAKGRIRRILFDRLYDIADVFLDAYCDCSNKIFKSYHKALKVTGVYHLEKFGQRYTMAQSFEKLEDIQRKPHETSCSTCKRHLAESVGRCRLYARDYFDGLCLDCMDRSDPLTGDSDKDYWQHNDLKEGDWIERCRIHHKQPTWYYSFMGRDETRNKYKELKKEKRRRQSGSCLASIESGSALTTNLLQYLDTADTEPRAFLRRH
ncbi:MAG: hypothetical protein MMC33_001106 [Icmadophila ericetorum]|nr:hypothetical protein [Icmadophila ericetorum]